MHPIAPNLNHPAAEEVRVAEQQPEYDPITMARVSYADGTTWMVGRWTFTPEERKRIAKGEDVYVSFPQHTFPHLLTLRPEYAGKEDK